MHYMSLPFIRKLLYMIRWMMIIMMIKSATILVYSLQDKTMMTKKNERRRKKRIITDYQSHTNDYLRVTTDTKKYSQEKKKGND